MSAAPRGPGEPAAGTEASRPTLSVLADLDLSVDGRPARLDGEGRHLVLTSEDPVHLWSTLGHASLPAEVGAVNGPRAVGRAASLLRDHGVTLDIVGPRGLLVRLGQQSGQEPRSGGPVTSLMSLTGRLMTGSDAVAPQSLRAVLPFGVRAGGLLAVRLLRGLGTRAPAPDAVHDPAAAGQPAPDRGLGAAVRRAGAVVGAAALGGALFAVLRRRQVAGTGTGSGQDRDRNRS